MLSFRQFLAVKRKTPEDPYYYHITRGSNMTGIAKHGLIRTSGHRNYNFSKRKAVYLASTPHAAKQYAGDIGVTDGGWNRKGTAAAPDKPHSLRVIRIPKTSIDPKKLHRDANMEWGYRGTSRKREKPTEWEYHGDIPAKKIEFSGGEHLKKKSRAWKYAVGDSLTGW